MDEEPIEILVGMAERGDVDPWNIDIVEITDRFLAELEKRRQLDLRISGRTLFYAATLLRMKSDYLEQGLVDGGEAVDDEGFPDEVAFGDYGTLDPIDRLEREIQRRLGRKDMREPPVTLYELIKLLKTAEKNERRRHRAAPPEEPPEVIADDVVSIAHREDYQEAAARVLASIATGSTEEGEIPLCILCQQLGWPIPDVYIPLLFLTLEGKVGIHQPDFFGELYIRRADT